MKRNNILITVDLEDWFQVENFKVSIPFSEWDTKEFRFENNTRRLLEIFEEYNIKATFFILGWNAERAPELVRDIHNLGHEIASHGFEFQNALFREMQGELKNVQYHCNVITLMNY